jgi:hypothetical protein
MKKILCGIVSFLVISTLNITLAFIAQAEVQNAEVDECVASFDMNRVNFKKPPYTQNSYLLGNYFVCRSAANDDVNECSNLVNPDECKKVFTTYLAYYGRLVRDGRLTKEILDACEKSSQSKKDAQGCEKLSELILKQDPSLCEKDPETNNEFCRALSSLDPSMSSSVGTRNLVYFLKAIKTSDKDLCKNIKSDQLKWLCVGGAKRDQRICETCEEIKEYEKKTCIEDIKIKKSYGLGGGKK